MMHRQNVLAWILGAALLIGGFYFVGPIAEPFGDQLSGSSTTQVVVMVVIQPPATDVSTPSTSTTSTLPPIPGSSTTAPAPPPNTTGSTAPPPPPLAGGISAAPEVERIIADETDQLRISVGLSALATDATLQTHARGWARQMASSGELEHSDIGSLLDGFTSVGENIGHGDQALALFQALVASPSHLEIMLGPYTVDGVGAVVDADGVLWVCQVFASSEPLPTTTTTVAATLPTITVPETTLTLPLP